MEHRQNDRFTTHKDVGIKYPGGKTLIGRTRDVSFSGLFLELDTTDLPAHALAQLLLPIKGKGTGSCLRSQVAIARHTREGIGLLYCSDYELIFRYLHPERFLDSMQSRAR